MCVCVCVCVCLSSCLCLNRCQTPATFYLRVQKRAACGSLIQHQLSTKPAEHLCLASQPDDYLSHSPRCGIALASVKAAVLWGFFLSRHCGLRGYVMMRLRFTLRAWPRLWVIAGMHQVKVFLMCGLTSAISLRRKVGDDTSCFGNCEFATRPRSILGQYPNFAAIETWHLPATTCGTMFYGPEKTAHWTIVMWQERYTLACIIIKGTFKSSSIMSSLKCRF